ncbi:ATP-binding cassette domain-containing protein [Kytococcus aerolatus]|uniref:ATP-binding cassette domain-containing protein n=1 Tax=Kytococcus aerolatus TaxID=592308 RepID=UPI000B58ADF8|nr:ABC transporter ATP-binding protein [Kytococcus aerolatus]
MIPSADVPTTPPRPVTWRRLATPVSAGALLVLTVGGVGQSVGAVLAGRLAEDARMGLVGWLALALVGGALLDALGRVLWVGEVDRAEGELRRDVLRAVTAQPVSALGDQAVGELLDRIDDDAYEIGSLSRDILWGVLSTLVTIVPMWVVAGLTWWPAWFLFPAIGVLTLVVIRPLLPRIAELKVHEEAAFTAHAAALEEGIAARDDLRTSLGQPFAVRRLAELSAEVHRRFLAVLRQEVTVILRSGLTLQLLMVLLVVGGALAVEGGALGVSALVTLFLVSSRFVGVMSQLAERLPDLQAGMGAVIRVRQIMDSEPEPAGGAPVPDGALDLTVRDLTFSYGEGTFALQGIDLHLPAGQTLALVGRTGSGKSTLASMVTRAIEPPAGTVLLGGQDVTDTDLASLRETVGTVTQRTEVLAGTLAQNITLFDDRPDHEVEAVVAELGLTDWVAALPEGIHTPLGPGGLTLSAGEEQLLAFARLLIRDVRVVVLDEATARMDPLTEQRVVRASERLLTGRTGILVAHRLGTIERADLVAVLDAGRISQFGSHADLSLQEGHFRDLLSAASEAEREVGEEPPASSAELVAPPAGAAQEDVGRGIGTARRVTTPPPSRVAGRAPALARAVWRAITTRPEWGLLSVLLFLLLSLTGAVGAGTAWAWGRLVETLQAGESPWFWVGVIVVALLAAPLLLAAGVLRYPRWWVDLMLRVRMNVLVGQTDQRRTAKEPAGEVVARAMDADRYVRYTDRWVDVCNGLLVVVFTAVVSGHVTSGLLLLVVMVASALVSALGRPVAGRSATRASALRAEFGRAVGSALESARTVKLAGRMPQVRAHLLELDRGRVEAAVLEHRVSAALMGLPPILLQAAAVGAWWAHVRGIWDLSTTLLVASTVLGFVYFGQVAGAVVTEAPGVRSWQQATHEFAAGRDLVRLPEGVDLEAGTAPGPVELPRAPLRQLELEDFSVVHDDGTVGVEGVDLRVGPGELVLLVGPVGSGKSSLLRGLAGLEYGTGTIRWNGEVVEEPETFLRPGRVAWVAQVPRVMSGSFAENLRLDHERALEGAIDVARLGPDVSQAGGVDSLVGHRGVRLSGGQVQRLALARALAADAALVLGDDVSSALDARTEVELWEALRERGATVIGSTSKRAALQRADQVLVLQGGRVVDRGDWASLHQRWGHIAG